MSDVDAADLYLELLKRILTRTGFETSYRLIRQGTGWRARLYPPIRRLLATQGLELVRWTDPQERAVGQDIPSDAETMVGMRRLDNLQACVEQVLDKGVPGDLIETGVWRGGACILMRAVLKVRGCTDRQVWVADSFAGMPPANTTRNPADTADEIGQWDKLAVSADAVRANFERYGLLDEQVRFLEGWFADTLPGSPIERLAVIRLDGDLYASTMDALSALYDRLAVSGYVIVDDFAIPTCRAAIDDFRAQRKITDEIIDIDGTGAYWRRSN